MKVKFQVPASLADIPLKDYIAYQKILEANKGAEDSEFVAMKMVSIFCNVSYDELQKLSLTQYDVVVQMLQDVFGEKPTFRNKIKIGDTEFGFIPKLDDISLGEYVDLENYMKSPTTYHKAMAVLYRPITLKVKETYLIEEYEGSDKYAEFFLDCDLQTTLGAMLFFLEFRKRIVEQYEDLFSGGIEDNEYGERAQFGQRWGWYQSINHLADGSVTRIDEVTKLALHKCLLKLMFDKQKTEIESNELKRKQRQ